MDAHRSLAPEEAEHAVEEAMALEAESERSELYAGQMILPVVEEILLCVMNVIWMKREYGEGKKKLTFHCRLT